MEISKVEKRKGKKGGNDGKGKNALKGKGNDGKDKNASKGKGGNSYSKFKG